MSDIANQTYVSRLKSSVLGATLQQLLLREMRVEQSMPLWIEAACEKLKYKDTKILDGLWSKGESVDEMVTLASQLNTHPEISFKHYSVKSVARILFIYFKKMPTPLLTNELHDFFLAAGYDDIFDTPSERMVYIRKVMECLPKANNTVLHALLKVFVKIFKDNCVDTQKATVELWGPVLLCRANVHDTAREVPAACSLLRFMIENYEAMFPQSADKQQKSEEKKTSRNLLVSSTPEWLKPINTAKMTTMKAYQRKVKSVLSDFEQWCEEHNLKVPEFKASISLVNAKLEAIISTVEDNPGILTQVIDTFHLERFYSYVLDFHTTCMKDLKAGKFVRHFMSRRLRGGMERLSLSMQYELVLFFNTIDSLFGGIIRNDPKNKKKFREHTVDFIKDQPGQEMWCNKYGVDSFMVEWERFLSDYNDAVGGGITAALASQLRDVLDDANTGFVSVYKFAEFLKAFGTLTESKESVAKIIMEPWFHGYVSRDEAPRILEVFPPGSFLIRFSGSDPGSFAINCKLPDSQLLAIKLDAYEDGGFLVREGSGDDESYRLFPSIPEIVSYYSSILQIPVRDKLAFKPWFYGDLLKQDMEFYLADEPPGTFLIRFSEAPNCFTCSYIHENGALQQARILRYPSGEVAFREYVYPDVDAFVRAHAQWFRTPYRNDNMVSSTQEEDELRRLQYNPEVAVEDEDAAKDDAEYLTEAAAARSASIGSGLGRLATGLGLQRALSSKKSTGKTDDEELLNHLLAKVAQSEEDDTTLHELLFRMPANVIDKVHKSVNKSLAAQFTRKKGYVKFSTYNVIMKNALLNKESLFDVKLSNGLKETVQFTILGAPSLTSQHFLSVSPSSGSIEPGSTQLLTFAVVLYKPVALKEIIKVRLEFGAYKYTIFIPLKVVVSKDVLFGVTKTDDYWTIPDNALVKGKRIGGGAAGQVFTANLYGAKVAMKEWDIGSRDLPDESFWSELNVLKCLQHENLVPFIGAIGRRGQAIVVLEFLEGGSAEKFLDILPPGTQGRTSSCQVPFNIRLRMAADAARGILYLHDRNLIHRDIKSQNILISKNMQAKVSDFGESAAKDLHQSGAHLYAGTDLWMAPEVRATASAQSSGGASFDVYTTKADVFSFGLLLYELLVLKMPEREPEMIINGRIPPIPDDLAKEHPELVALIRACCRYNPDKRPTFFSIVRQLEQIRKKYEIRTMRRPTK